MTEEPLAEIRLTSKEIDLIIEAIVAVDYTSSNDESFQTLLYRMKQIKQSIDDAPSEDGEIS
jgi:hypothetical protein